eukprot:COSAG02_NODE_7488_length_2990_cov_2.547215_4_plen_184_part_00
MSPRANSGLHTQLEIQREVAFCVRAARAATTKRTQSGQHARADAGSIGRSALGVIDSQFKSEFAIYMQCTNYGVFEFSRSFFFGGPSRLFSGGTGLHHRTVYRGHGATAVDCCVVSHENAYGRRRKPVVCDACGGQGQSQVSDAFRPRQGSVRVRALLVATRHPNIFLMYRANTKWTLFPPKP